MSKVHANGIELHGPAGAPRLVLKIPHAELHALQGAGHTSCWERAQEFNAGVPEFLAKQNS